MELNKYKMELEFLRRLIATNPSDPNLLDTHILNRQRNLILEKGETNTQINKYLKAIQISKEKGGAELNNLLERLQQLIGLELTEKEKEDVIAGKLESLKETLEEVGIGGATVFFWDTDLDKPAIGDHMILGFLKAASEALGRALEGKKERGKVLESISYTQSLINQHVAIDPMFIPLDRDIMRNEDGSSYFLQRSLRVITAKGPRVSLAKSEIVTAGAKCSFVLKVLKGSPLTEEVLRKLFDYGELKGLGQWRNAGNGEFKYTMTKIS